MTLTAALMAMGAAVAEPSPAATESAASPVVMNQPSSRLAPVDRRLIPLPHPQPDATIDSKRPNKIDNRVDNKVLSTPSEISKPSEKATVPESPMKEDDGIDISFGPRPPTPSMQQRNTAKSIAEYYQRTDTTGRLRAPVETYGNGYVTKDSMGNRIRVRPRGADSFESLDSLGNRTRIYRSPRGGYETVDSMGNRKSITDQDLSEKPPTAPKRGF